MDDLYERGRNAGIILEKTRRLLNVQKEDQIVPAIEKLVRELALVKSQTEPIEGSILPVSDPDASWNLPK